jgi:hypothetical protein
MSGTGLDYATRRKIREFIRLNMTEPLTAQQIMTRFRLRPDDEPDVRELLTETAILGVPRPEVVTEPVVLLDLLISWLASSAITPDGTRTLLLGCQWCRNHLLYALDTAPYSGGVVSVRSRLLALPEVHRAHGPDGPDQDAPRIRWVTP